MEGPLLKRSDWLNRWNLRHVALMQVDGEPVLAWRDADRKIDRAVRIGNCRSYVDNDELIVTLERGYGKQELRFRSAPGGVPIGVWHSHVHMAGAHRVFLTQNKSLASRSRHCGRRQDPASSPSELHHRLGSDEAVTVCAMSSEVGATVAQGPPAGARR